jgi:hypothetical protein
MYDKLFWNGGVWQIRSDVFGVLVLERGLVDIELHSLLPVDGHPPASWRAHRLGQSLESLSLGSITGCWKSKYKTVFFWAYSMEKREI